MKTITFYFDPISPYAYLAFMQLPQALEGISHQVLYRPILFAGLLRHYGQLGPAEIEPKKAWTFRQVQWLAHEAQLPLQLPSCHPFNPLGLLRLALQTAPAQAPGLVSRFVAESIFRAVWESGEEPGCVAQMEHLRQVLNCPQPDEATRARVSAQLRSNTDAALAKGVFGVPTMEVDGSMFWGADSLLMLRAYLLGDNWFTGQSWQRAAELPAGVQRKR